MKSDIDHMLRDLERQVQDFTLNMNEHQTGTEERQQHRTLQDSYANTDNVPLQHYKTRGQQHYSNDNEAREDNISIGTILQRSATARRPANEGHPIHLTQSRSMRSTSGRPSRKREESIPPLPTPEDEELRIAMQRAWAVLDDHQESKPVMEPITTAMTEEAKSSSNMVSTGRIQTVPLKTLTTKIYIDDAKNHKVVQLSNLLTTAMVVQYLKRKGLLDDEDGWSLFEIDNKHGVERPLREWEIVLDVLSVWEPDAGNALLAKKYSYHSSLTSESIFQKKLPPMHGWISIEYKKGKWQKRYCFIKDNAIHHAKDNKGSSSSILCHLGTYDVYTLLQPIRISPTPYVFAIRAQERSSIFEKETDYMRFLAVEDQEDMKDWVLGIRCTKSNIQYKYHPNRVANPLAHISLEDTLEDHQHTLRRHKTTREPSSHKAEEHAKHPPAVVPSTTSMPRSDSTRRVDDNSGGMKRLGRSGTTRGLTRNHTISNSKSSSTAAAASAAAVNTSSAATETESTVEGPLIDCIGGPTFAKGSLLAKEEEAEQVLFRQQQEIQRQHEEVSNSNTLIQIDNSIKFSKGSLLDQKEHGHGGMSNTTRMTRSKSVREVSSSNNNNNSDEPPSSSSHRRHVSLRRKPTASKRSQHHDVPLPNNAAIASLPIPSPLPTATSSANAVNASSTNNSNNTLLQLNESPERFHTRELHGRHVKPLLNFDSINPTTVRK